MKRVIAIGDGMFVEVGTMFDLGMFRACGEMAGKHWQGTLSFIIIGDPYDGFIEYHVC